MSDAELHNISGNMIHAGAISASIWNHLASEFLPDRAHSRATSASPGFEIELALVDSTSVSVFPLVSQAYTYKDLVYRWRPQPALPKLCRQLQLRFPQLNRNTVRG